MIASFTQTYSNNRNILYHYHNKDNTDIYFRNKLDKNYYVFHNSSKNYQDCICQGNYLSNINNLSIISYNDISYTQTIFKTLQKCKEDGVKYLFFLQDDVFPLVDDNIIDELLLFIKNNSFDMLNIEVANIKLDAPIVYSSENLKIYDTTSDDFKAKKIWSFDDGPYVASLDFLMTKIYDDIFFSKNDIWSAEIYLHDRVGENKIERLSTNLSIFKRMTIVGPNACNIDEQITFLNERFKG
jgi:hypothetical protein